MTTRRVVWYETHLWGPRVRPCYQLIVKKRKDQSFESEEAYHQILQKTPRVLELHIYSPGSVRSLLEKDSVASDLAYVDGDFLDHPRREIVLVSK